MGISRVILALAALIFAGAAGSRDDPDNRTAWLRDVYSGPVESWPAAELEEGAVFEEFGPLPSRQKLDEAERQRADLGRRLFKDPRLSASGQIACESCHNRRLGWGDGLPTSFGHDRQTGTRNAPSLFVSAHMKELFWDGRSPTLEDQAHLPISNPIEMAADAATIEKRINADPAYRADFAAAYQVRSVTMGDITSALAAFERSIPRPAANGTAP